MKNTPEAFLRRIEKVLNVAKTDVEVAKARKAVMAEMEKNFGTSNEWAEAIECASTLVCRKQMYLVQERRIKDVIPAKESLHTKRKNYIIARFKALRAANPDVFDNAIYERLAKELDRNVTTIYRTIKKAREEGAIL